MALSGFGSWVMSTVIAVNIKPERKENILPIFDR
jgi:hypothetical protein